MPSRATARNAGREQVFSIQYLRAAAALGVVAYHCGTAAGGSDAWPLDGATVGVDVFFVISGFIMWVTTAGRGTGPVEFWKRRVERIVPLYWIVTAVALAAAVVVPSVGGVTSAWHAASSFAFLPANNPDTGVIEPLVAPGWSLNFEMFFYLVFGLALALAARLRLPVTLAALALTVVLARALPDGTATEFFSNTIVFEFVFGLGIGAVFSAGDRAARPAPGVALVVGAVLLFALLGTVAGDLDRFVRFGVPAAMLVGGAVWLERAGAVRSWAVPRILGDASYSLYLTHGMVLTVLEKAVDVTGLPSWTLVPLGLVAAVVVGLAVYYGIERPCTAYARGRRRRRRSVATSTA